MKEKTIYLIRKFLQGNATEKETNELYSLFENNHVQEDLLSDYYKEAWEKTANVNKSTDKSTKNRIWRELKKRVHVKSDNNANPELKTPNSMFI